ncbi:molybdopterin-dependent oxidoreductase, partial [Klebsiella pneumoniae]|nr:molybdopterin-dependent oxidoreductase [Klebsiella pneumoniae]
MAYSEKVIDHYENPRNVGSFDNSDENVGSGMVGAPACGAGVNHWYHMDMNYRGMINLLVFCGCVGQSGGGWSHYVGQEKLRPQTGRHRQSRD